MNNDIPSTTESQRMSHIQRHHKSMDMWRRKKTVLTTALHFQPHSDSNNLYIFYHPSKVKANCFGIIISIFRPRHSGIIKNVFMISCQTQWQNWVQWNSPKLIQKQYTRTPCWRRYQNLRVREVTLYQCCSNTQWPSSW